MLADRLEFLIGVGHDMRAPLTGIAGFAAVLAELDSVNADGTAVEAVAYIRREAQRLVELLNQLLDFGQVERGGPVLDLEPIDLVRLARQAVEPWAARHHALEFRIVHQGGVDVEGDFLKLHRVLANLLDNAVRYSPPGGTVTIELAGSHEIVTLMVVDEGEGIPPRERRRVFQRFVRLAPDGFEPHPSGRAGIGLYVVKGLVEAHGGSVRIADGPGARLLVTLPRRQPEPESAQALAGYADI